MDVRYLAGIAHALEPANQEIQQVERFRKAAREGGARFLVCTDAAGEKARNTRSW
ncbi:MAG: hypothetical protein K6T86_13025 [Pirellulales bacterium]|nr:hypothetical protein [Pirellulales bacterium]